MKWWFFGRSWNVPVNIEIKKIFFIVCFHVPWICDFTKLTGSVLTKKNVSVWGEKVALFRYNTFLILVKHRNPCYLGKYCGPLFRGVASIYARTPVRTAEIWKKKIFSLNLLANNFIFSHYTGLFFRIPIIQASIIQCWPLIMAKCIWVVSKNRKNASFTPPSR